MRTHTRPEGLCKVHKGSIIPILGGSCQIHAHIRLRGPIPGLKGPSPHPPQGDRPLPAPRETGLLDSSLRRRRPRPVGGVAPPRPQLFSFLFFCFLCTDEGLSSRVAERSSAVRGCRAALSRMVLYVCCLLRVFFLFRPVVYLFFLGSTGV